MIPASMCDSVEVSVIQPIRIGFVDADEQGVSRRARHMMVSIVK